MRRFEKAFGWHAARCSQVAWKRDINVGFFFFVSKRSSITPASHSRIDMRRRGSVTVHIRLDLQGKRGSCCAFIYWNISSARNCVITAVTARFYDGRVALYDVFFGGTPSQRALLTGDPRQQTPLNGLSISFRNGHRARSPSLRIPH